LGLGVVEALAWAAGAEHTSPAAAGVDKRRVAVLTPFLASLAWAARRAADNLVWRVAEALRGPGARAEGWLRRNRRAWPIRAFLRHQGCA